MPSDGRCNSTAYTTKEGYYVCQNTVLNLGCDNTYFDGDYYYGKSMFTCPLPPVGRALRGGEQERGKRGGIRGGGALGGRFNDNRGMHV